jgi:hypothetical protein
MVICIFKPAAKNASVCPSTGLHEKHVCSTLGEATLRLKLKVGDVAQSLSGAESEVEKTLDEPIEKAWETANRAASVA